MVVVITSPFFLLLHLLFLFEKKKERRRETWGGGDLGGLGRVGLGLLSFLLLHERRKEGSRGDGGDHLPIFLSSSLSSCSS